MVILLEIACLCRKRLRPWKLASCCVVCRVRLRSPEATLANFAGNNYAGGSGLS
ncbi:MAG: hypothetical protein LBJ00_07410 [Planctomycetaceae bacterium]|nr:hypothetical protein [Planctomycetaceae bacterium]